MSAWRIVPLAIAVCGSLAFAQATTKPALIQALESGEAPRQMQALNSMSNSQPAFDDALAAGLRKAAENPKVAWEVARTTGQIYVWVKDQNPRAIEFMRELARSKDPETRYNAVYFGLSTVRDKSDEIITAMLDAGARAPDYDPANLHGRIAWGLKGIDPQRFASLCEPYWAKLEENERSAWLIYRLFVQTTDQEPPQAERFAAIKAKVAEEEAAQKAACAARVPALAQQIRQGDSKARMDAFTEIYRTKFMWDALNDSVLEALIVAADDPSERVRAEVARISGNRWVWSTPGPQHPKAIELALRLRKDMDWNVRHYAVYFGLSTVREPSDEVLAALVESSVVETDGNTTGRTAWKLKNVSAERLLPFFEPYFANAQAKPAEAERAVTMYTQITGGPPPRAADVQAAAASANAYVSAFDDLLDHLQRVYPRIETKKLDWEKIHQELTPRVDEVKDDRAFGLLCLELVARLEDSHAHLVPGSAPLPTVEFPQYDPGFACLIDDRDRPVVYYVDANSPAQEAGVKIGMAVVSVNGVPAADAIRKWMDQVRKYAGYSSERYLRYDAAKGFIRQMKQGGVTKLEMEDVAGKKHEFDLPATLGIRYLPRLPVPIEGINDSGSVEAKKLDDGIGYIYVRRIRGELPEALDAALKQLGEIKGLIIDVRGNSGGGFDGSRALRNFDPNDNEEPDRPRYAGPIALLIDERCISAGEGWASWFFANKRARVFGTTTAGASSRKAEYTLTNGLYKVIVPVRARTGFLDRPIERRGLEPDVPVRVSAVDLAAGKDTVLETAKAWLREQAKD